jgi:hypothetical protein
MPFLARPQRQGSSSSSVAKPELPPPILVVEQPGGDICIAEDPNRAPAPASTRPAPTQHEDTEEQAAGASSREVAIAWVPSDSVHMVPSGGGSAWFHSPRAQPGRAAPGPLLCAHDHQPSVVHRAFRPRALSGVGTLAHCPFGKRPAAPHPRSPARRAGRVQAHPQPAAPGVHRAAV